MLGVLEYNFPVFVQKLFERKIIGIDLNKTTSDERMVLKKQLLSTNGNELRKLSKYYIPESFGIVIGVAYVGLLVALLPLCDVALYSQLLPPLVTIMGMLLIGFLDDILNIRWRNKLFFSIVASLPNMCVYLGSRRVPFPLVSLGIANHDVTVDFRIFFVIFSLLITTFCVNSINILAGVNGVEVGQSMIIGASILIHAVLKPIVNGNEDKVISLAVLYLLIPFLVLSWFLWKHNRYPSEVFVGDSYTYFAGGVLACAGVLNNSIFILLCLFLPQLLNFVISLPQLFQIIPCPPHRVPIWDLHTNKLKNSKNYTLLNLLLWIFGEMSEEKLTALVLKFQIISCSIVLVLDLYL